MFKKSFFLVNRRCSQLAFQSLRLSQRQQRSSSIQWTNFVHRQFFSASAPEVPPASGPIKPDPMPDNVLPPGPTDTTNSKFEMLEPWNDHSLDPNFHPTNVVWIDDVFRTHFLKYSWRSFIGDQKPLDSELTATRDTLRRAFYPKLKIEKVVPVWKEQGCFVYFDKVQDALQALTEQDEVRKHTHADNKIYLVQGVPFVEDLKEWRPSTEIHISTGSEKLTMEQIFYELRQFGRLKSLKFSDGNYVAKFADIRSAIAARACLHGKIWSGMLGINVGKTPLSVAYAKAFKLQDLWKLVSNTRALAIIVAVLAAAATLLIIAPIRSYFVTQTLLLGVRESSKQKMEELQDCLIWQVLTPAELEMRSLLMQQPSAVTVLSGDRGTGKSKLLQKILNKRLFSVRIDCGSADSVQEFINVMERAIGFTPSFNTLNSAKSYLDAVATLGVKQSGISDTSAAQLRQMLTTLSASLYVLSLRYSRTKNKPNVPVEKESPTINNDDNNSVSNENIKIDDKPLKPYLVDHSKEEIKSNVYSLDSDEKSHQYSIGMLAKLKNWISGRNQRAVARKRAKDEHTYAVVVLDNFSDLLESMSKQSDADAKKARDLLDMIVEFSSNVTTAGLAHVVVVSHTAMTEESLRGYPALQGKVQIVHVDDVPLPVAAQYIKRRLGPELTQDSHVNNALKVIGGRSADIEELVARVRSVQGATLQSITDAMLSETSRRVLTKGFGDELFDTGNAPGATWKPKELWKIILALDKTKESNVSSMEERNSLDYDTTLLSVFKGNEIAARGLVEAEILSMWHDTPYKNKKNEIQRGTRLTAASPKIQCVFDQFVHGKPLMRKGFDSMVLMADLQSAEKEIANAEEELKSLNMTNGLIGPSASAMQRGRELDLRLKTLNSKVSKIEENLRKVDGLKPGHF